MAKKQKLLSDLTPKERAALDDRFRKAGEEAAEAARLFRDAWKAFMEGLNKPTKK
jgi:hypothetical protein